MQGPDVLTELIDCQQHYFQAACKSAASGNAYASQGRYSASCSMCKLAVHSSAVAHATAHSSWLCCGQELFMSAHAAVSYQITFIMCGACIAIGNMQHICTANQE